MSDSFVKYDFREYSLREILFDVNRCFCEYSQRKEQRFHSGERAPKSLIEEGLILQGLR